METASIVRPSKVFQHDLFSQPPRLVLHKFTPEKQSLDDRKAVRAEVEHFSMGMPVFEVHSHNDPVLDTVDVINHLSDALKKLTPSADPEHRIRSLVEVDNALFMAELEFYDLRELLQRLFEKENYDYRTLRSFQHPRTPPVVEIH